jgi:hypothetical protein
VRVRVCGVRAVERSGRRGLLVRLRVRVRVRVRVRARVRVRVRARARARARVRVRVRVRACDVVSSLSRRSAATSARTTGGACTWWKEI